MSRFARENGLSLFFAAILLGALVGQSFAGLHQSEFLAVGTMAVFAIYLRQRGSAESKPVGAAHTDTDRTN